MKKGLLFKLFLVILVMCLIVSCEYINEVSTITFDPNGDGVIWSVVIKSGEKISEPATPSKDGYVFEGWYLGDIKFDFSKPITSNITLRAAWSTDKDLPGEYVALNKTTNILYRSLVNALNDNEVDPNGESGILKGGSIKLLNDVDVFGMTDDRAYKKDHPAWLGSLDLNNKKLTVNNFTTIVTQDKAIVENGTIRSDTWEGTTSRLEGKGSYSIVVMADDVTLRNLTLAGGISLGGSGGETPNAKGAKNAVIENCNVTTYSEWYAVCAQSGSAGTIKISNSTFERRSSSSLPLFQVVGSEGDFGAVGDINTIKFENVICKTNPFPVNEIKTTIGGSNQQVFSIIGEIEADNREIKVSSNCSSFASSDVIITKNSDGTWTVNGTISYTIQKKDA